MSSNPYGIMNTAKYNYFAHIRYILYGEQEVSTAKRITLDGYIHAANMVRGELLELEKLIKEMSAVYDGVRGTGPESIKVKIDLDNLYLRRSAYDGNVWHERILYVFRDEIQRSGLSKNEVKLSFSKLIEHSCRMIYNWGIYRAERQAMCVRLKSTFKDDYIVISNSHLK